MPSCQIATLNLQNFAAPPYAYYDWEAIYSPSQWQMKTGWLRQLWQQAQLDVVAMQEVFSLTDLQQVCTDAGLTEMVWAGQPALQDEHIYTAPVVALASRYPLQQLALPEVTLDSVAQLGLSQFSDSRTPLLARVQLPLFGEIDICVGHLKSRRPDKHSSGALAAVKSQLQRMCEAALLQQRLAQHYATAQKPLLVCGDFNDEWSSALLEPLRAYQQGFMLQDAATLATVAAQAPTHYYGAHGKVLDYVLCSAEFDARYHHAIAELSAYRVWDQHLRRPTFALDGHSSDHAMVHITLQGRK